MKNSLFTIAFFGIILQSTAQVKVQHLLCENLVNPLGLDMQQPRLSWQLVSEKRNTLQASYEIDVFGASNNNEKVWSTGKIISPQSLYVPYAGTALQPNHTYYWRVRVWDNYGKVSGWSETASWKTGLLNGAGWKAKWIEPVIPGDSVNAPAILFRKNFNAGKKIQTATAYITSHGMYEAMINGRRVGEDYFTPGWTSYNKRLQYQAYDVTALLKQGQNAAGVVVGSGWYRTPLAWDNNKNIYGDKTALLFQLEITYADGTAETVISDETWRSADGPIRSSEIYNGEYYDANYEREGWAAPAYDDRSWAPVAVKEHPKDVLVNTYSQPVKKHEIFKPVRIFKTPKGEQVIDFGQNLVGWEQLRITGKKGDKITINHAEVLDKNGNFYTDNLRAAKATNTYILKGGAQEFFEPHFTFQGFRYIRVEGYTGEIKPGDFSAVALYSDMKPTGDFNCSNPLLNQLQHNIQWGQRGNFLDVPTDCPQRDERLGWTGDAQAFSRTATFNMDVHNFFCKWLQDVAADQDSSGKVPFVVPNVLGPGAGGSAGWADVATIVPWNIYLAYGDKQVLERQYESMKAWVGFMRKKSNNYLWNTGFHFGDWLFYRPDDDNDGRAAVTDKYMIAQCFFAHSTQLVINTAKVLGNAKDVEEYSALLQKIKSAFLTEYATENGRLISSTQTAYVLALNFDMFPEELRKQAAKRLVDNIESYGDHITTGFLGTPYICHVLTRFGYDTVAYKLLLQDTYPSWLYPVKMGATTIWERWDGQKPDSSFQSPGMNSFNHYAYGAIGDWMYRVIAGIDTDAGEPGYKTIIIKPHPGGNISFVNADFETCYGKVSVHWKEEGKAFLMDVEVPANTAAKIYLPSRGNSSIKENGKPVMAARQWETANDGYTLIETGSGTYHFSVDK